MPSKLFWISLILLALLAMALLAYATPEGMGLVNDSVGYIDGARSITAGSGYARLAGDGTTRPITHFPPLYSLVLAALSLTGLAVIPAAQVLNLLLFGGNVFLAGLLIWQVSRSAIGGILAAALLVLSEPLLRAHTFALSEPLFLFCTLLSLECMWRAFEASRDGNPWLWLVLAGVTAGLSTLTRYVGAALIAAALLAILFFFHRWKQRLLAAGAYLLAALPPVVVWSLRNLSLTGSAANRGLSWHPLHVAEIMLGVQNFWGMLLPARGNVIGRFLPLAWAGLLAALLLAMLVWGVVLAVRPAPRGAHPHGSRRKLIFLLLAHAVGYLALVLLSMTLIDASTTFEDRILAPFYLDVLLLIAAACARLLAARSVWPRILAGILVAGLLLSFADDTRRALPVLRQDGQGFASTRWTNSQTMDAIGDLPGVTLYTNRLSAVTVLAGRPAYALLGPVDPVSQQLRPDHDATVRIIRREVAGGRAALVVFSARDLLAGEDGPWLSVVVKDLPIWKEFDDGIIYGAFP